MKTLNNSEKQILKKKLKIAEEKIILGVGQFIPTAITAWYIPIIRHLLQHSWWSAWRYVLLGNNKNQERSVKEKNFMVYWERLNVMFGYTWGRHYEIS